MTAKPLNIDAKVTQAIAESPEIDAQKGERARDAMNTAHGAPKNDAPAPQEPAVYADDVAARHGRVTAKSLNIGFNSIVGEKLDSDMETTLGDVMGEMFGIMSRLGNRWLYLGLLAVGVLPVFATVGISAWKAITMKPEKGGKADG